MITASNNLKNIFYDSVTVNIAAGATIEYNMNNLLDNITISTTATDQNYQDSITYEGAELKSVNPFKKLFPLDSILNPFRPVSSGIKYYILADGDNPNLSGSGTNPIYFYDYRTLPYPSNAPRVYYAGVSNAYKYWVAPQNTGIDVTVKYIQSTATVTRAYSTGPDSNELPVPNPNRVTFETDSDHGFIVGNRVSINMSGSAQAQPFDLTNQEIIEIPDSRKFVITNSLAKQESASNFNRTATLVNSSGTAISTKPALANKIVIAFEKYHALPSTCSTVITYSDNTTATVNNVAPSSDGRVILYYNGSTWSATPPFSSSQPISYSAPKEIKTIRLTTSSAGSGKIIAVTEISARWIKDISSDVVSFEIEKETTSNPEDILPVGNLTANSLQVNLVKYDQSNLKVLQFNRDLDWTSTPPPNEVIYLVEGAEIVPHFKIFHSNGAVTEGSSKYDIVNQGVYFLDSDSISEYGDSSLQCLDGSRQLMQSFVPELVFEDAPATAVISGILDSIGFSNYNINIKLGGSGESIDTSIPTIKLWWSNNDKFVWDSLQELCRDIQMNAFFDENNILQFYSRDVLYYKTTADWEFNYSQNGNKLPNIVSIEKKDIVSGNQIRILWTTPMSALYNQNAKPVYTAPLNYLISGGLREDIEASTPAELVNFNLDLEGIDSFDNLLATFNFSGYFLVDSEVFEYDAIEYQYEPLNSNTIKKAFVGSESDWAKYRSLSKIGKDYFKPTGRYRIKSRAAFGTTAAKHFSTTATQSEWPLIRNERWK
jgi:hypothetical protein